MSGSDPSAAAIARLEERLMHITTTLQEERAERRVMATKLDAIEKKMDEGAGGLTVIKWFFPTSLAGALALGAMVYSWFKS
ncbi:hypothetical protein [Roseococcus microcysteis]|uniref:hypothetical protein n=1 Tax=Roseococcus microcysteis TaxID=2771361 RepID=UPI00168B978C|nr:hypothetical protein [Roseococcus microcysteis]